MQTVLFGYIAILLLAALLSTRIVKVLKLPNVTAYIVTGIIMGPYVFGVLFNNFSYVDIKSGVIAQCIQHISWISTVALGFIAFSIGTSFKTSIIKTVGKRVIIITLLESLLASLFVFIGLFLLHIFLPDSVSLTLVFTLSAIAAATAPAATLMIIKQYNAKGPLVNTLLPVVALDDASALILFAILFQVARTLLNGGSFDIYLMVFKPLIEIGLSIAFGVVIGLFSSLINKLFKSRNNKLILCIFSIFSALGLWMLFKEPYMGGFELSSLLICMASGAIYTNLCQDSGRTLDIYDRFTAPMYMMFFVVSGASLDLTIFFNPNGLFVLLIALVYILFRVLGKWLGAFTGSVITKADEKTKKYLGLTLIPQAGVAIGLATSASNTLTATGNELAVTAGGLIIAIILSSTLVYELVGPLVSKYALKAAGEIEE